MQNFLFLIFHYQFAIADHESDWSFYLKDVYFEICINRLNTCDVRLDDTRTCCGFCKCDQQCKGPQECCFLNFYTFQQANNRSLNANYECFKPQLLFWPETKINRPLIDGFWGGDAYWMISTCDTNYTNAKVRELCMNPGQDGSVESAVPVTLISSREHFRNKYCAVCNLKHTDNDVVYWEMDIFVDEFIPLPDHRLLDKIKSDRGNIYFIPPVIAKDINRCHLPSFSIGTCNETGKWPAYNEFIERACNAFTDPYNHTYKNIFCHYCNEDHDDFNYYLMNEHTECNSLSMWHPSYERPNYRATVNIDTILGSGTYNQLDCRHQQFRDMKLNVCRDVFCHVTSRQTEDGRCRSGGCFGAYLKMESISEARPSIDLIQNDRRYLQYNVLWSLNDQVPNFRDKISVRKIFYHANEKNYVDYFLLYLIIEGELKTLWEFDKEDKAFFLDNRTVGIDIIDLVYSQHHDYSVSLTPYHISNIEQKSVVYLPYLHNNDTLYDTGFESANAQICSNETFLQFNKIYLCPYFKIRKSEFDFSYEGSFLRVSQKLAKQKNLLKFQEWEYLETYDNFLICVEDYLSLYVALAPLGYNNAQRFNIDLIIFASYFGYI